MAVRLDPEQADSRAIHDLVDFAGEDVLEVGCGDGRLTWRYAEAARSVLAIDVKEPEIAEARSRTPDSLRARVSFRVADVTALDLQDESFDVAVYAMSL